MTKKGKLYIPAITVVMVVITLVVLHSVSTFSTLDRQWAHWQDFLERNAGNLISVIAIEARSESPDRQKLKEFLNEITGNPDIAYVGLLDRQNRWILGSRLSGAPDFALQKGMSHTASGEKGAHREIISLPDGRRVFQFTRYVALTGFKAAVIGLWMAPFEEARKQDHRHAFMMVAILLVLGSAAIYFIFVVQNYYLVATRLAEMKSYTENVVESMADGLVTVDTMGKIVSTNRQISQMLGLDTRQLWGRPLAHMIPLPDLDIYQVIRGEKGVAEKEIDCPGKSGDIPMSVSATPLKGPDGAIMGAVIILRDLREIRELQQKVQRSERLASLGKLASGVAHEIRNPLSSIKGFAQYFRDKFQAGSEDRSYATIMIQEVERLNRVIDQLLDFARPKDLDLRPHLLSEIIDHPLQLIHHDLDENKIRLITSIEEGTIRADSDQMTQALLNIFLNAMDSMKHGGELSVAAVPEPEEGRVDIRITDTGTGISPEYIQWIFDPFFSTKKKGTGLGLAITAKIIEAHEGEISAESQQGKGTTFKIRLSLDKPLDVQRRDTGESKDTGG